MRLVPSFPVFCSCRLPFFIRLPVLCRPHSLGFGLSDAVFQFVEEQLKIEVEDDERYWDPWGIPGSTGAISSILPSNLDLLFFRLGSC